MKSPDTQDDSSSGSDSAEPGLLSVSKKHRTRFMRANLALKQILTFKKPQKSSATIQLDVKVMEEQAERITGENMVVKARQTRRHLSVTSLTAELQKVPYLSKKRGNFLGLKKKKKNERKLQYHSGVTAGKLQIQVDDLLEKVTEKSIDLLAQKHAELQQCEFLGEEILQSSKHFQLASKRTMRMYKRKYMHFPCTYCC